MATRLEDIAERFGAARVLVMGDVMLDRFVYGDVGRISPEAPIPVLAIAREVAMPGGAANVARNVASLGGHAILIGVAGEDRSGDELAALLAGSSGITAALVRSRHRPTTQKTRYVADRQQVLRTDVESRAPCDECREELLDAFRAQLAGVQAVVLSDYGKGVLCDDVVARAIAACNAAGLPVVVDPKSADLRRYDGATVLTPNRAEAAAATHIAGNADADVALCASEILKVVPALKAALVTRGADGMTLAERGSEVHHIASAPRAVFDVSGAGDTAVATLALSLATGADLLAAAELANLAAGIAVSHAGTAAVSAESVIAEIHANQVTSTEAKVVSLPQAVAASGRRRARGERIGFTNGCFDLIHPGHVSLLAQARAECDFLIVGLNRDASIRRLKGEGRPIQDETARAIVLASLRSVDLVVPFGEDTPENLIRAIRPDVLVKGADYTVETVVGADVVQSYGGKVLLAALTPGESTTGMITKLVRSGKG